MAGFSLSDFFFRCPKLLCSQARAHVTLSRRSLLGSPRIPIGLHSLDLSPFLRQTVKLMPVNVVAKGGLQHLAEQIVRAVGILTSPEAPEGRRAKLLSELLANATCLDI